MAILTARQPVVQAPDVVELGKFAANMIQSELAARTQIGQFVAQQQQNDLKLQAQGRQEIRETYNDRYTRERQARVDALNERLQLSQDRRAEERLKMDQRLEPLDYAAKQLALRSGNFNLSQAQTLAPYKVAEAKAQAEGAAVNVERSKVNLEEDKTKLPVSEGQAELEMQQQNLAKVASGSLNQVKTEEDMEGWAPSNLALLPGNNDERVAKVNAHITALDAAPEVKARMREIVARQNDYNKILNSNGLPPGDPSIYEGLARSGAPFIDVPGGRRVWASELGFDYYNKLLKDTGSPTIAREKFEEFPKPPATATQFSTNARLAIAEANAMIRRGQEMLDLAKQKDAAGDGKAAQDYTKTGLQLMADGQAAINAAEQRGAAAPPAATTPPNLTIDPTKPAAPTGVAAPINPRRAAVLGLLPKK